MYASKETLEFLSRYTKVNHINKLGTELSLYNEGNNKNYILVNIKSSKFSKCMSYLEYDKIECNFNNRNYILYYLRHPEKYEEFIVNMNGKELKKTLV